MGKLIRDTEAAARFGIPLRELHGLVDGGELAGYQRDERVWVDEDQVAGRGGSVTKEVG